MGHAGVAHDTELEEQPRFAPDWASKAVAAAAELERQLGSREHLDDVLTSLERVAQRLECDMVTGASGLGHQLAGALSHRSGGALRMWMGNGASGTVLVVDGVLATGVQIAQRARDARRSGATRVVAAAILATDVGLETARALVEDEVVRLQGISLY